MERRDFLQIAGISALGMTLFPGCQDNERSLPFERGDGVAFIGDSITFGGDYINYLSLYFIKKYPDLEVELNNIGLSSETVSGLSEKDHPFPRPVVFDRLDQVLTYLKPDVAVYWYGVNCGIYNPFSEENFTAYQKGIQKLIEESDKRAVEVILMTPAPLAMPQLEINRLKSLNDTNYKYSNPYPEYNTEVLARYRDYVLSLEGSVNTIIDAYQILMDNAEKAYDQDYIHPNRFGHWCVADGFLKGIGFSDGMGSLPYELSPEDQKVFNYVKKYNEIHRNSLVFNLGAENYWEMPYLPLEEAKKQMLELKIE